MFFFALHVGSANVRISEGNRIICPNTVGLYQCTVFGVDLRWRVNGSGPIYFVAHDPVGTHYDIPNAAAFLIERNITNASTVEGQLQGTRVSILQYTPPPDYTGYINMTCEGGSGAGERNNNIYVVGGK